MKAFKIRLAEEKDKKEVLRVNIMTWKESFRGLVPQNFLDSLSVEGYQKRSKQKEKTANTGNFTKQEWTILAETNNGEIVGMCRFGSNRGNETVYDAEIQAIYVLPDQHGKGLGQKLLKEAMKILSENGFEHLIICTFEKNPAHMFYEKMGGILLPYKKMFDLPCASIPEVSYGWTL